MPRGCDPRFGRDSLSDPKQPPDIDRAGSRLPFGAVGRRDLLRTGGPARPGHESQATVPHH